MIGGANRKGRRHRRSVLNEAHLSSKSTGSRELIMNQITIQYTKKRESVSQRMMEAARSVVGGWHSGWLAQSARSAFMQG